MLEGPSQTLLLTADSFNVETERGRGCAKSERWSGSGAFIEKCSHSIAVRGHPGESWLVEAERCTNNQNFHKKIFFKSDNFNIHPIKNQTALGLFLIAADFLLTPF